MSGDRVDRGGPDVRLGRVTLLGFDPATSWIADGDAVDVPLWRRLLPPRSGGTVSLVDDQTIVSAVTNLPSLALPPIGALLVLLLGYIVLIGPVNYLVLRSIDRREWAWVTVPIMIAVFTVGSFGIGALLRGSDVILNEVASSAAPRAPTPATTQSYLGIFSPSRATYQLRVAGDALLAAPMNGDMFGGGGGSDLDVLQGDPSRVRDLSVGFGSLRTVRAEASATGPTVTADLRLEDGHIKGTVTNKSNRTLIAPAIVLGSSASKLKDLAPGQSVDVNLALGSNLFNGTALSDTVVGQFDWNGGQVTDSQQRTLIRRAVIDQLSFDPNTGINSGLAGDSPTLLAWGTDPVVSAELVGAQVRHEANVLYEVPLPFRISGRNTFSGDLLRSSPIDVSANFFTKDPWTISFGIGQATMAYQPLPFEGALTPDQVVVAMGFGGDIGALGGKHAMLRETERCDPAADGCVIGAGRHARHRGARRAHRAVGPVRAHGRRPGLRARERRALGQPGERAGPGEVREREAGRDRLPVPAPDHGDRQVSAIVHTAGLVKRYDRTLAVAGLDLDVAEGEIFGLVGPNGAGKTTTLRILATLLVPDAGDAEIAGFSLRRNPNDVRRVLGFMPDSFGVYDDMKVWEYLDFFARCYGIPADRRRRMIGDLLDLVDLGDG